MTLLRAGDRIALVAPSGFIEPESLKTGAAWLEAQGFELEFMPHVFARRYYTAGTDFERADDINEAFARPDIKALFCVRGGAGSSKILPYLDYATVKKNRKPVFGLSDSTALQNALFTCGGNVSYTGFLPIFDFKSGELDEKISRSLNMVFAGREQKASGGKCLNSGATQGVMVGGCLSVLNYLCGTPYFPSLQGKILLIEDVGEKTYRLDLMLNQLKLQKDFAGLNGIVFGQFLNCAEADEGDGSVSEIIADFAQNLDIPVITDFPYGHIASRYVLPIGKKVCLNADEVTLVY